MGYTLYWNYHKPNPKDSVDLASLRTSFSPEFITKVKDAIKVAAKAKIKLGDWDGSELKEEPITDTVIRFNGSPESCETFALYARCPATAWDCCKTRLYPYTIVCMEVLQLALEEGIIDNWSTDGDDKEIKDEWRKLYKRDSNEGEQIWEDPCMEKTGLNENS